MTWQPRTDARARQLRASLNTSIRQFFDQRGVLEVETPLREAVGNPDPQLAPVPVGDRRGLLRTSAEFALKRLVAAGSGPIYELGKVFRGGENGRHHHPEFTMAEWYRPGLALDDLIDEVVALLRLAGALGGLDPAVRRISYDQLLDSFLGQARPRDSEGLRQALVRHCAVSQADAERFDAADCLDLLFASASAALPQDRITVVDRFPADQAALARLDPDEPGVARRFEVFWGGLELANGYDELLDADELTRRLKAQSTQREHQNLPPVGVDQALIDAHHRGLPACCGVSVGVDRLLMVVGGYDHINQVLNFPEVWP